MSRKTNGQRGTALIRARCSAPTERLALTRRTGHSALASDDDVRPEFVVVSFSPDDDRWLGKLHVSAAFDGFSGHADAWVDAQNVAEFGDRLTKYPIDPDEEIRLSAGLGEGANYQEQIGLQASARGGRGQLIVLVHLTWRGWRPSLGETFHETRFEFPTSYEYLGRFGRHLAMTVRGEIDEARLDKDVLA